MRVMSKAVFWSRLSAIGSWQWTDGRVNSQ